MSLSRQTRSRAKTEAVCQQLYDFALQREPHAKLPTTRELCDLLETSRTTLNEALNMLEEQNVLYRKQSSGIYVSPKIHRRVIYILLYSYLFLGRYASPFWGMLWGLLAQEAEKRSETRNEYYCSHLILRQQRDESALPEEVLTAVQLNKVHGVLTVGTVAPLDTYFDLHHIPCVAFAGWGHWNVALDMQEEVRLAVKALAEQGCRSIGFWGVRDSGADPGEQPDKFRAVLAEHGLPFEPSLFRHGQPLDATGYNANYQEQGYQLARDVFAQPQGSRPDGLVINNDMMTSGMLVALHEMGIQIGSDLKIATHTNAGSPTLYGYEELLIRIEHDPARLVETMYATLDAVLNGQPPEQRVTYIRPVLRLPA